MIVYLGYEWLLPQFGIIDDIVMIGGIPYFIYFNLQTWCFNHHYHAYEVIHDEPIKVNLVKYDDLGDYHPLSLSKTSTDQFSNFVCMKYNIAC